MFTNSFKHDSDFPADFVMDRVFIAIFPDLAAIYNLIEVIKRLFEVNRSSFTSLLIISGTSYLRASETEVYNLFNLGYERFTIAF